MNATLHPVGRRLRPMSATIRRRASGFSMIELLVAVLVMGIGVLGITGLQMVSLQNNRDALLRAEATQLAYDMMDRIRANPLGAPLGTPYAGVDIGDAPPGGADCVTNACTANNMVAFDLSIWKCSLGDWHENDVCVDFRGDDVMPSEEDQPGLPDGDGSIEINGAGTVTITVQWTGPNNVDQTIQIDSQS